VGIDVGDIKVIHNRLTSIEKTLNGFARVMEGFIRLQEKSTQQQKEIDYAIKRSRENSDDCEKIKQEIVKFKSSINAFKFIFGIVSPIVSALVTAGAMKLLYGG